MMLLAIDAGLPAPPPSAIWSAPFEAVVPGSEEWARASRRLIEELRDDEGLRFPLRNELWVTMFPPRNGQVWRVEGEGAGLGIVGRGKTSYDALHDWRKRMRAVIHRFLEMRPFEMTEDDRNMWTGLQSAIDFSAYRAGKPLIVRQLGKIIKLREGVRVVQWEDGAKEKVNLQDFDECFKYFQIGQPFEAKVTRHPTTFRIIRADAVRKVAKVVDSDNRSSAIWERATDGATQSADNNSTEIDEEFWLKRD